jgi:8-oxo-dGTP diphosphatase
MQEQLEHDLFQVAVKGLYYKDGKFLMMKDEDGEWDFPGGRIHKGEDLVTAMQRECQEELGVECKVLSKTPKYAWVAANRPGSPNTPWRIDVCFEVDLIGDFKPSEENVEHGYFTVEEARKLNLCPHLANLKEFERPQVDKEV